MKTKKEKPKYELTVSAQDAAEIINLPLRDWPGKCTLVALLFVKHKIVEGYERYGHWRGPISRRSHFASRRGIGFTHHGWIELEDGRICDPTRWVFEAADPYVYIGVNAGEYDLGGDTLHQQMWDRRPVPEFNPKDKTYILPSIVLVEELFGHKSPYSFGQLFWLANQSMSKLGDSAKPIYEAIVQCGLSGLIPYDFKEFILHGR